MRGVGAVVGQAHRSRRRQGSLEPDTPTLAYGQLLLNRNEPDYVLTISGQYDIIAILGPSGQFIKFFLGLCQRNLHHIAPALQASLAVQKSQANRNTPSQDYESEDR